MGNSEFSVVEAPEVVDVLILGAGGAGMMCAIEAGRRGRKVLLIDHSKKLGGKILISGGGRCNFTNMTASPLQYVSKNNHFSKSALSRYTSADFLEMVKRHGIAYHEKKLGQLFCDHSARDIVQILKKECEEANANFWMECQIEKVENTLGDYPFQVITSQGMIHAQSLVIATGGLSIPKIGATGLGYQIARQFGLKFVKTVPALDGFTFTPDQREMFHELSGISVDCQISTNGVSFRENILLTHTGLSGPAALQASLHWNPGDKITLDLSPDRDALSWFIQKKKEGSRATLKSHLSEILPKRLAEHFCEMYFPPDARSQLQLPLPQVSQKGIETLCSHIHAWTLIPSGTVGYSKAEVTRGGVDTDELSSKTMECKKVAGLYFIGEVVDVTGWLGGYNFQWAWSSGWAAGQVV
jgi:predicted Rossmann fold flavoprotein